MCELFTEKQKLGKEKEGESENVSGDTGRVKLKEGRRKRKNRSGRGREGEMGKEHKEKRQERDRDTTGETEHRRREEGLEKLEGERIKEETRKQEARLHWAREPP